MLMATPMSGSIPIPYLASRPHPRSATARQLTRSWSCQAASRCGYGPRGSPHPVPAPEAPDAWSSAAFACGPDSSRRRRLTSDPSTSPRCATSGQVFGVGCETRPAGLSQRAVDDAGEKPWRCGGRGEAASTRPGAVRNRQTGLEVDTR